MTGQEIRQKRRELGISLEKMAELAGTSPYTVHALETGRHKINPDVRGRILGVLGAPPETASPAPPTIAPTGRKKPQTWLRVIEPIPKWPRYVFEPGAAYVFRIRAAHDAPEVMHISGLKRLRFLRDVRGQTVHHVFLNTATGGVETFTDSACLDWKIGRMKE